MDISVIIINYNTFDLAKCAIESIFQQTQGVSYEIILVDNLSPDGSGDKLKEYFGEKLIYLQAGENLGTSRAFNLALKSASGNYILWLNPDILIKENFIKKLYDFMEGTPDCGICGGNLLDFEGKPAHSFDKYPLTPVSFRKKMSFSGYLFEKIFRRRLSWEYNYSGVPMQVSCVIGADMLIRRCIVDEIGGFDEDIFMYCEETEFAYRMQKETNYKVYSVPSAQIYHLEGASFQKEQTFSERRYRLSVSGKLVYFRKYFGDEGVKKYLKFMNRSYIKFIAFCTAFFMYGKAKEYRTKRRLIKEFIQAEAKI